MAVRSEAGPPVSASGIALSSQDADLGSACPCRPGPSPRPEAGSLRTGMMARVREAGESRSPPPAIVSSDLGLRGFTTPSPTAPGLSFAIRKVGGGEGVRAQQFARGEPR